MFLSVTSIAYLASYWLATVVAPEIKELAGHQVAGW
jgi:hypothetical protein